MYKRQWLFAACNRSLSVKVHAGTTLVYLPTRYPLTCLWPVSYTHLDMMTRILTRGYLGLLLALLYSPILIIMIFSFTEAKVLGNWTGFSTKLYSSLFTGGMHHSLINAIWNTFAIALLAATASTALGSIAAIGIFNPVSYTHLDVYKRQD